MSETRPLVERLRAEKNNAQVGGLCQEAADQIEADAARIKKLRDALVGLVGASDREELNELEIVMRTIPAPVEDKAKSIDAIHALLAVGDDH